MEPTVNQGQGAGSPAESTPARERELLGLLAAAQAVLRHRTFEEAARVIFDHCRELIGAPSGYISLSNEAGDANELVFLEAGGLPCTVDPLSPMPIRGLRAEAYRSGAVVWDNEFPASDHQRFLPEGHVTLENVLFAPLKYGERTVGLLGLANKPGGFTENDRRLAAGFAELAAIALVNSRAESAVRRSQAQLSLITDSLPVLIAYVDRNRRYRFANRQHREWLGLSAEQAEGRLLEEVLGPELSRAVSPVVQQVLEGQPVEVQARHQPPRGAPMYLAVRLIPHNGQQGGVHGFFLLAEDITTRREAETQLKESRDLLEQQVLARTAELRQANELLLKEMAERREAQAALDQERSRLFALLDNLPAYVFLQAPDHTLKFANRFFREHFGEPLNLTCHELLWGRKEPCRECPTELVFHTHAPHVWEWTRPDGRSYQIFDYPFADVDGSPLVLEMGIDITGRKRAEEALREQSRLFEAFFNHTITPLVFLDPEFNFLRVNEAYARACRRSVADFTGRNHFELYPHPENQAIFAEVVRTKTPHVALAKPFVFPDHPEWGTTYWDWTLVPILDEAGQVEFLVFSLNDVTARVRSEETQRRLTAILEATSDLVGFSDPSGRVLYLNQAGRRMVGLGPAEELGSRHFLSFHPPWVQEKLMQEVLPVAKAQGLWQGETAILGPDGQEIPISQVVMVHRDADGQEQFYSSLARDISRQRQVEDQLRQLTSQLLTAQEQERQRLARELHDELGQSLLVLKMQLRAIERQLTDPAIQRDCARASEYLTIIVDNVRRLSRDLAPSILEDLGLSAALRNLLDEFQRHHDSLDITAEIEPVEHLLSREAKINLYRVFQESLTNIAKHAQATRVAIRLQSRQGCIAGAVEDNGAGMARDSRQGHPVATGLGLSAMEERLRILGGTLEVASEPGRGTHIRFSIPISSR